jgi:hypothetical protein
VRRFGGAALKRHTFDSLKIGYPQIGQVLKVTGYCGDGRGATPKPIACGPDIGQVLNATGLPGSGGCPISGLLTVVEIWMQGVTVYESGGQEGSDGDWW